MTRRWLLLLLLAAGCGSKADRACADACDHLWALSLESLDALGDPELAAAVKREARAHDVKGAARLDRDRCVESCRAKGLDTACVLRAKALEDAMTCPRARPAP